MKTHIAKLKFVATSLALLGTVFGIIPTAVPGNAGHAFGQDGPVIPPDDGSRYPTGPRGNNYQQPYYVTPPTQPGYGSSVRPESWPTGNPAVANISAAPAMQGGNPYGIPSGPIGPGSMMPGQQFIPSQVPPVPPPVTAVPCEGAINVARVGTEVVLSSDLQASVDEFVSRFKGKVPAEQFEAQRVRLAQESAAGIKQLAEHWNAEDPGSFVDSQRRVLLYQMALQIVEVKMLYLNFLRTVPKEAVPNVEESVSRHFDDNELASLLKREKAVSREELEIKLRAKGSSLEHEKMAYTQRLISQQWIREKVNPDKEITHDQMLEYYEKHKTEHQTPAKAHWEELAVQFGKFPTKEAAYKALADMGNQVLLGAAFDAVAKAGSQGITAAQGGDRGWNTKGSLAAKAIDEALFGTLTVGQLSPILESNSGYHIVRLIERKELATTPFSKIQAEIKDKIKKERLDKSYKDFMEKVRKEYPVWTVFDAANKRAASAAAAAASTPSILSGIDDRDGQ